MRQKTIYPFLSLMLTIFFSSFSIQALPPIIEEIETSGKRSLSIRGNITTRNAHMGLRTVEKKDITNPCGSPGPVSLARMNENDMRYDLPSLYAEGKNSKTHHETTISYGIWKNRLEGGPHYEFTVLYVLEDFYEPSNPKFMGYIIFYHESPNEFKLFSHIVEPYQKKGFMTILGQYLLQEFIPAVLTHPLTREKASTYKKLLYQPFYLLPPNIDKIIEAVERFSKKVKIQISPPSSFRWSIDIAHLPN